MTCLYCGGIHDPEDLERIGAEYEVTEDGWLICPTCQQILNKTNTDAMLIKILSAPLREGSHEKRERDQSEDNSFRRVSETIYSGVFGCS